MLNKSFSSYTSTAGRQIFKESVLFKMRAKHLYHNRILDSWLSRTQRFDHLTPLGWFAVRCSDRHMHGDSDTFLSLASVAEPQLENQ